MRANSRRAASRDSSSARKVFQGAALALCWTNERTHVKEDAVCGGSAEYEWEDAAEGPRNPCHWSCHRSTVSENWLTLFCNAFETDVVIVGVVAVAGLLARSTTYDAALPTIRRARRANCVCVVVATRMLRQQYRAVAEQDTVLAKRERAARFDQTQCFGSFRRQLRLSDGGQRARCDGCGARGLPRLNRRLTLGCARCLSSVLRSVLTASAEDRAQGEDVRESPRLLHETVVSGLTSIGRPRTI